MPPAPPPQGGNGNGGGGKLSGLKHKLGPLPMWGWMALILGLALGYELYKSHKAGAASTATGTTSGTVPANQTPDVNIFNQETELAGPSTAGATTAPPPAPTPANPGGPIKTPPSQPPRTTRPGPPNEPIFNSTYKVKANQTLEDVAAQFHITREQLAHANGLGTGAGLRTGQTLHVPSPAPGGKPNKAI